MASFSLSFLYAFLYAILHAILHAILPVQGSDIHNHNTIPVQGSDIDNHDDNHDDDNHNTSTDSIIRMSDNRICERKNMFDEGALCVGSSDNWLMFLGRDGYPFLLQPSSDYIIRLPQFPHTFLAPNITHSSFALRKTFVNKFVFMGSASPSHYFLAILYGYQGKIALCVADSWVELSDAKGCYCDIVFINGYLYALATDGSVEGWDVCHKTPSKDLDAKPAIEKDEEECKEFPRDKFSTQLYLVISKGEFLLVKRYIGNFADADGVVVDESYTLSSLGDTPCPYGTKHFTVYALDFGKIKWEKKRILLDQALFVGTNESPTSLNQCLRLYQDAKQTPFISQMIGWKRWIWVGLTVVTIGVFLVLRWLHQDRINPPPIWLVPT